MSPPEKPPDWNQIVAGANIVIAIGTIILATVAIFGRSISRYLRRPILKALVKPYPPSCHKTFLSHMRTGQHIADCYYFRLWIENEGKTSARNVEVFANRLLKKKKDGTYKTVSLFSPMNLIWSDWGKMIFPAIHPGTGKHCDIFHIVDPSKRKVISMESDNRNGMQDDQTILSFDTRTKSNTKGHLQPSGAYRLEIVVAAENAKPLSSILRIETTGEWINDEDRMLSDGVAFGII